MKKTIIMIGAVAMLLAGFCLMASRMEADVSSSVRTYQHEEYAGRDSGIGVTEIGGDAIVGESFVTHLPLVIIEADREAIPNIYRLSEDGTEKIFRDEDVTDPWADMKLSLVENGSGENGLTDTPVLSSEGRIKIRGASSREFAKKQYGIKLLDGSGMEQELSVLGMEADEDWVLSGSILDASSLRNYIAYNVGGQIFAYTPEAKFCEVVFKEGDTYYYEGLYLLSESVKKGEGRVNIADFDAREERLSYIICRDRADATGTTLSTWASDSQLCYGWFTFKYPKEELLTEEAVSRIEAQISAIEQVLYSEDEKTFLSYPRYIDVDSFVDYFVVNEFFMNYDAGDNSTYYYQDYAHKLSMGPLWDYDNCWDNYSLAAGDADWIGFQTQPWFERLVRDPQFVQLACARYRELRETIFSTEYLEDFIDGAAAFLGNAVLRERSRWRAEYEAAHMLHIVEEGNGYLIDRNRETYGEELVRLKDMMGSHGAWMDEYMDDFLGGYTVEGLDDGGLGLGSAMAVVFFAGFIIMIVLINRKMKGL